jgi:hypothetical protein
MNERHFGKRGIQGVPHGSRADASSPQGRNVIDLQPVGKSVTNVTMEPRLMKCD